MRKLIIIGLVALTGPVLADLPEKPHTRGLASALMQNPGDVNTPSDGSLQQQGLTPIDNKIDSGVSYTEPTNSKGGDGTAPMKKDQGKTQKVVTTDIGRVDNGIRMLCIDLGKGKWQVTSLNTGLSTIANLTNPAIAAVLIAKAKHMDPNDPTTFSQSQGKAGLSNSFGLDVAKGLLSFFGAKNMLYYFPTDFATQQAMLAGQDAQIGTMIVTKNDDGTCTGWAGGGEGKNLADAQAQKPPVSPGKK